METLVWKYAVPAAGGNKTLRIMQGDICRCREAYDLVVCSAYQNDYRPVPRTLIRALQDQCGIQVEELAKDPEIDLKTMGCWLSRPTGCRFPRVACVELFSRAMARDRSSLDGLMLKGAFSTLRYLLEQADLRGIPLRSVILPVLGAGSQGIELCYLAKPLLHQCLLALTAIPTLETITFCERDAARAGQLAEILDRMLEASPVTTPDLFISYSSRQAETALRLRKTLEAHDLRCWMAPDSIPAGSSYQEEIPIALGAASMLVLLLTPEAEQSRWVQKEVGMAIGSGHVILPYQPLRYPIGKRFQFLLDGEQIFPGWNYPAEQGLDMLTQEVRSRLQSLR